MVWVAHFIRFFGLTAHLIVIKKIKKTEVFHHQSDTIQFLMMTRS